MTRALPALLLLLAALSLRGEDADSPGEARLILPPVVHALAGLEANVYFDNAFLLLDSRSVVPDVVCAKGSQQSKRWTWTPKPEDVGDHAFRIELRDERNAVVASASSVVRVHPRDSGNADGKTPPSLLIIGDSLTAASVYPTRILELAKADGLPLTLVGTRGPGAEEGKPLGEVRHEGYGGWTAERFATHFTGKARGGPAKECGSPFLYRDGEADEPKLDLARYYGECNDGAAPDFVTLLLGCNDTFSATDETIEERIDRFVEHTETLLAEIRRAGPATRVGLLLPMPPAASQDAFGASYGSGQTRWQYLRNRHRLVERMTETFAGRGDAGIDLVAAHLNLDPVHGFPSTTVAAHAHTEAEVVRQSNGVHPSPAGYRQIGDAIYAWLRGCPSPEP